METEQTNKIKNTILNLVILVVVGIIAFSLYQKNEEEKARLNARIGEEKKKSKVLESIDNSEKSVNAYRKLLNKKDSNLVMATISNLAKEQGVKIASIKPGPELRLEQFIKYPYILTLDIPGYHALGKFISALESSPEGYVIDSVDIGSENADRPGKLMATVTVCTVAMTE
jgi:Tfp pilus assembly protein PilO